MADLRRQIVGGWDISVRRTGKGESSKVRVTGLPPLSQDDARWLVDALSRVTLMPPRVRSTSGTDPAESEAAPGDGS